MSLPINAHIFFNRWKFTTCLIDSVVQSITNTLLRYRDEVYKARILTDDMYNKIVYDIKKDINCKRNDPVWGEFDSRRQQSKDSFINGIPKIIPKKKIIEIFNKVKLDISPTLYYIIKENIFGEQSTYADPNPDRVNLFQYLDLPYPDYYVTPKMINKTQCEKPKGWLPKYSKTTP